MLGVARDLARLRQNVLWETYEASFAFCGVILGKSNISFDKHFSYDLQFYNK